MDLSISVTALFWSQQVEGVQGETFVIYIPRSEVGLGGLPEYMVRSRPGQKGGPRTRVVTRACIFFKKRAVQWGWLRESRGEQGAGGESGAGGEREQRSAGWRSLDGHD